MCVAVNLHKRDRALRIIQTGQCRALQAVTSSEVCAVLCDNTRLSVSTRESLDGRAVRAEIRVDREQAPSPPAIVVVNSPIACALLTLRLVVTVTDSAWSSALPFDGPPFNSVSAMPVL